MTAAPNTVGESNETSLVGGDERSLGPHHSRAIRRCNRDSPDGPCVPPCETTRTTICPGFRVTDAPHDLATRPIHGHRRPPRRRRLRARRDGRPLDRRGLGRLARLLHQRRRRRRGSRPRSARAGALSARREQDARPRIVGYEGVDVPPPARRRARQRPGPARAARPRDPDLPAGRGPGDRPGGRLLPRRRREPHRPPRGRHGRGRRGLSRRPQPDGVPVARPVRARRPRGPAALPLLAERADRPRRRHRHDRPEGRRAARPREPDQGARRSSTSGCASGRARRASRSASRPRRRSGSWSSTTTRTRDPTRAARPTAD